MRTVTAYLAGLALLSGISATIPANAQTSETKQSTAAADSDPAFEVATIKPSDPDHPVNGALGPHRTVFSGTTIRFLMAFAYDIHDEQIVNAPGWMATEKFDVTGASNSQGVLSARQIQVMLQKLLTDRMQLTFHHEKRELSVYVLTVAKNGPKLSSSSDDPNGLHSLLGQPQRGMKGHNLTMADFASRLQSGIVDRPVVDGTKLQGQYDFLLKWTPDETQFNQVGVRVDSPNDNAEAPGLFSALQEQLGLKLTATRMMIDVLVIDGIARPSEN